MNCYAIYIPISSIMCGFACFERFLQILTLQATSMILEDLFEAQRIKEDSKEGPKWPRSKYHGLGRANDEATKRNEEHLG